MNAVVERAPRPPALEVAVAHALVERVNSGAVDSLVRLYRPAPTVAFGRLDRLRPGFADAVAAGVTGVCAIDTAPVADREALDPRPAAVGATSRTRAVTAAVTAETILNFMMVLRGTGSVGCAGGAPPTRRCRRTTPVEPR